MKKSLSDLLPEELGKLVKMSGEKPFRAVQIFEGIHGKLARNISEIPSIPKSLSEKLKDNYTTKNISIETISESKKDGTKKILFKSDGSDNIYFESVYMSEKERRTLCISTQAGCNAGCVFCATGILGFKANLTPGQIVGQVYEVINLGYGEPTNIVFMGMGEPFLNYENTIKSLKLLTSDKGRNFSAKKIVVSTIGIKNSIRRFADDVTSPENIDIKNTKLAFSLHSTDNDLRAKLIPLTKMYPLKAAYDDITYYYRKTRSKITYEYIFFDGLNNGKKDIKNLTSLSGMIPCNINIIPYHPTGSTFLEDIIERSVKSEKLIEPKNSLLFEKINDFIAQLRVNGVTVHLRTSNGIDIEAACGQLAAKMAQNK